MRRDHPGQLEQQGERKIERRVEDERKGARPLQRQNDADEEGIETGGLGDHAVQSIVRAGAVNVRSYTAAMPADMRLADTRHHSIPVCLDATAENAERIKGGHTL